MAIRRVSNLFLITQMLFLISLHIEVEAMNCSQPPEPMDPNECCRFPKLFKQNVYDYCSHERKKNEQCFFDCVFTATEIRRRGVFSLSKAYDYVDWVMEPENSFSSIYKRAFEKCIKAINAEEVKLNLTDSDGCSALPEMAFLCVQNEMFAECPSDFWNKNLPKCDINREFITNCIERK